MSLVQNRPDHDGRSLAVSLNAFKASLLLDEAKKLERSAKRTTNPLTREQRTAQAIRLRNQARKLA